MYGRPIAAALKGMQSSKPMKAARILKTAPVPAQWHLTLESPKPGSARSCMRKNFLTTAHCLLRLCRRNLQKAVVKTKGVLQKDKGIQGCRPRACLVFDWNRISLTIKRGEYLNSEKRNRMKIVQNIIDALKRYKDALENNITNTQGNGGK